MGKAPKKQKQEPDSVDGISLLTLAMPIKDPPEGVYHPDHVQVGALDVRQRRNLKRLFTGLHASHKTLRSGRHVDSNADVIRWILEAIGDPE